MKKLQFLLLPLCLLLVLSACKKNSTKTNVTGTFTATIGGKTQTFNVGAQANLQHNGDFYTLGLIGVQSASASNSMIISITSSSPITAKTYSDSDSDSPAQMSYTMASGAVYQDDGADGTSGTVTIKSITNSNVQGTFSGTLMLITGTGAATQTVTNGTFNLDIK